MSEAEEGTPWLAPKHREFDNQGLSPFSADDSSPPGTTLTKFYIDRSLLSFR